MIACDSKGLLCKVIQNNNITGTRCLDLMAKQISGEEDFIGPISETLTRKSLTGNNSPSSHNVTAQIISSLICSRYFGCHDLSEQRHVFLYHISKGDCNLVKENMT